MIDPHAILQSLAKRRPVFHSEADFQHEFAWELRSLEPCCEVRLEVPSSIAGVGTTDIVVRKQGRLQGVELKYLTRRRRWEVQGEVFHLKAQGAQDLRRYDVMRDIQRLEAFNRQRLGPSFVIVLTNDPSYWKLFERRETIDSAFRLHDGRIAKGRLAWASHAGAGTIRSRNVALELSGSYALNWRDYSDADDGKDPFRYLMVEVSGQPCAPSPTPLPI